MTKDKEKEAFKALKAEFNYTSTMQSPRLTKVVVTVGINNSVDKKKRELILERLARITGQKPAERGAKKSIANFKVRQGDTVGYQITLRGARMYSFVDKLIHIAFPRVRDFRGVSPASIDEMGNVTFGFKEHTVFPETADEEAKDIFGLAVNIGTTAKNKKEAEAFLRFIGVPFKEGK